MKNNDIEILTSTARIVNFTKEVCESAEKYKLTYAEIEALLIGYATAFKEAIEKNPKDANKLVTVMIVPKYS